MDEGDCPFEVGELVIFTNRSGKAGWPGHDGLPEIGARVKIIDIIDGPFGKYLRWEGMSDYPGGPLHWTEFSKV
jgi:hypothetical protein